MNALIDNQTSLMRLMDKDRKHIQMLEKQVKALQNQLIEQKAKRKHSDNNVGSPQTKSTPKSNLLQSASPKRAPLKQGVNNAASASG